MMRLVLDHSRKVGFFARREAEKARRVWFECTHEEEIERLWSEYRRREMGARAEEVVGRYLDLLDGWESAKVFHAVEFRGAGLPRGDVDHLVLFEHLGFALAVESKYRLGEDVEQTHLPRAIQYAQAVSDVTGMYTWPVLSQALRALRDDIHDESIRRRWSSKGSALLCDAEWLPRSIQEIVGDLDAFRAGAWRFSDQQPKPEPAQPAVPMVPEAPTPVRDTISQRSSPAIAVPAISTVKSDVSLARRFAIACWWLPGLVACPFLSWIIAALLTHSRRYVMLAVIYALFYLVLVVSYHPGFGYTYWAIGFFHVSARHKTIRNRARFERTPPSEQQCLS